MQTDEDNSEAAQAINDKIKGIFDLVMSKYEPAKDKSLADEFRTSDQIYSQMFEVYPSSDFGTLEIYDLMNEAGFKL